MLVIGSLLISNQKDQIILATGRGILADFWVPHDIESCNFQNLHVFGFPETSQNLISFRQLLFSLFQRGYPLKKSQNPRNLPKLPQTGAKMIWSFGENKLMVLMSRTCYKFDNSALFACETIQATWRKQLQKLTRKKKKWALKVCKTF